MLGIIKTITGPSLYSAQTLCSALSLGICLFQALHIRGVIMLFVLLCMPCLPKNDVLKVVLPCGRYQTSTFYGWNIVHSTYTRFINLLSHWTLVLSSLLAVVNSVHVNMGVWAEFHIYLTDMAVSWACVCVTFREITRCFHSQCSISYSYQQCTSVPVSPYFLQYLPFPISWMYPP